VVVVAELFLAEAWARAAVAVGEDVAALVLLGFGCCGVLHSGVPRPVKMCAKSSKEKTCVRTSPVQVFWVKGEGPAFGRAAFFYLLLF
jgi:hypothetical protein